MSIDWWRVYVWISIGRLGFAWGARWPWAKTMREEELRRLEKWQVYGGEQDQSRRQSINHDLRTKPVGVTPIYVLHVPELVKEE